MNRSTTRFHLPQWAQPSDSLTPRQKKILLLVGLTSMSAAFINTLFTQTVALAADEFNINTSGQGIGAAVVRLGILLSLPLATMADRRGRRPLMITVAWLAPIISSLGALAPNFATLVATQTIGRPLGLTLDILVAVVAVEEMPRNSRAYATGLLAVLSGVGAGVAVAALPIADIGTNTWRYIYVIALIWLVVPVALMKWLPESQRFAASTHANHHHRSVKHLTRTALKTNLGRICSVVFLTNMYIATASIFQNRYLKDDRAYSATMVALFTTVTALPASIGLILGGKVADERGRRIIGATLVPLGAFFLAASFAVAGPAMWTLAILGGIAFGVSYPAMAVYRGELFPTSVRSIAGGIIMTSALLGGIIGLVAGGWVLDRNVSYGTVMLWLVLGPVLASVIVWFRYPETAHMELEDITHEPIADS